jgi:hypothetical protein
MDEGDDGEGEDDEEEDDIVHEVADGDDDVAGGTRRGATQWKMEP